jgi:hypothetical protein
MKKTYYTVALIAFKICASILSKISTVYKYTFLQVHSTWYYTPRVHCLYIWQNYFYASCFNQTSWSNGNALDFYPGVGLNIG